MPMSKNVPGTPYLRRMDSTCGVQVGSGPSSKVSATRPRALTTWIPRASVAVICTRSRGTAEATRDSGSELDRSHTAAPSRWSVSASRATTPTLRESCQYSWVPSGSTMRQPLSAAFHCGVRWKSRAHRRACAGENDWPSFAAEGPHA